jgi:hypothetical protein
MKEEAAGPLHSGTVRPGQTRLNRVKPNQIGSKPVTGCSVTLVRCRQIRAKYTILIEMIMLVPWPKMHSVGLIKLNQTKSNLWDAKKVQNSKFTVQKSMVKPPH